VYVTGQQLADALKGNSSLTSLDMGGNNIGPEGITVVLNALRGNDTLETLELSFNPIGDKGAKALSDVLKYDVKVRHIRLSSTTFAEVQTFREVSVSRCCSHHPFSTNLSLQLKWRKSAFMTIQSF
jgi:hypothetical protein